MTPVTEAPAQAEETRSGELSNRAWILSVVCVVVLSSIAFVGLNRAIDVLGLYGRNSVSFYSIPRYSDSVASYRFVPANFDGFLVGNSTTFSWDLGEIHSHRVFNFSLPGSTITESRILAHNMMERGNVKVALISLSPSLFSTPGRATAYLTDKDRVSALGSLQLVVIYFEALMERVTKVHFFEHRFFRNGGETFFMGMRPNDPGLKPGELDVNPESERDFHRLVDECHERGVKVYLVIAPLRHERWLLHESQYRKFYRQLLAYAGPRDTILNMNEWSDSSMQEIRYQPGYFPDWVHPDPRAVVLSVKALAPRIR